MKKPSNFTTWDEQGKPTFEFYKMPFPKCSNTCLVQKWKDASIKIVSKKEEMINTMSNQQILSELKDKQLPVYGTN